MCTIFAQKSTPKCKKQMEKPSALFVTLHFALFVVLTVMRCGTIVAVCHCDGCKLAVVVFAVMATSTHVTTDCLLVLHSSTSFFKLSVHNDGKEYTHTAQHALVLCNNIDFAGKMLYNCTKLEKINSKGAKYESFTFARR